MYWIDWDDAEETIDHTEVIAETLAEAVGVAYALCDEHGDAETATVYEPYGSTFTRFDVRTGEIYETYEDGVYA